MKKIFKKILPLILISLLLLSTASSAYAQETSPTDDIDFDKEFENLEYIIDFVTENYLHEIDKDQIIDSLYYGFFELLDEYSEYYNEEEYQALFSNLEGNFVGIGVRIQLENSKLIVVNPLTNSPAEKVGILAGDEIITVDGQYITGLTMNEVTSLIKGEEGTLVDIGILRNDQVLTFTIERSVISDTHVTYEILEDDIGYLKIEQFAQSTLEGVEEALAFFDSEQITDLVIDLRNNPGGVLDVTVDILNYFVPEGPVLNVDSTFYDEIKVHYSDLEKLKYDVCVLVNENSASASEIFAGAIQDRDAGEIIGTNTFGKGIVQSVWPLFDETAGMKFTTAEYFTPNLNKVHGIGITPDLYVDNTQEQSLINLDDYPEFKKEVISEYGDVSLDVLAAEMILETLGYSVNEPDGIFDWTLRSELLDYQKNNELYSNGKLDFETQDSLASQLNIHVTPEYVDYQLIAAIEKLTK